MLTPAPANPLPVTPFAFIWHFMKRPHIWLWLCVCSAGLIALAFIQVGFSLLIKSLTNLAQGAATLDTPPDISHVWWIVAGLCLAGFIIDLIRIDTYKRGRVPLEMEMKSELFRLIQTHNYDYFVSHPSGMIAQKITDIPWNTVLLVSALTWRVFPTIAIYIYVSVLMTGISPWLSLASIVWITLMVSLTLAVSVRSGRLSALRSTMKGKISGFIVDSIANNHSVRVFARGDHEIRQADHRIAREERWVSTFLDSIKLIITVREVMVTIYILTVLGVTLLFYRDGGVTIGDVAQIVALAVIIKYRSIEFDGAIEESTEYLGNIREGLKLLTKPVRLKDTAGAPALRITKGQIDFSNVRFAFAGKEPLFDNFNLSIPPGQKVGLVGHSGAGKSTLMHLLLRFYDTHGGTIKIDEQDIRSVTQESLHGSIAVIPQDTMLFHRTLMNNIRYGLLNADDEAVFEACRKAYIHDFIRNLPNGYETMVGERGVRLSGGQRQRIAIARALLKNAPVLLLDEATSALDSESERYIHQSLVTLMEGKTVIAIAHRLSTIAHLDRIIVLDEGRIVEDGPHAALLAQGGAYARLWGLQSGGFLPG